MESPKPRLSFAESGLENREKLMKVQNVVERLGLPTYFKDAQTELDSKTVLDIDTRALEKADCPLVVFGRPHVGEYVPTDILDRMTEGGAKMAAVLDRGTQSIFRTEKVPSVGFKISRWVVDPNRAPDPTATNVVPGQVLWKKPAMNGDKLDMAGTMYKEGQEPTDAEIQDLVERFYIPYYNAMMSVVGAVADRRTSKDKRVLLIDGHSFPSIGSTLNDYYEKAYGYGPEKVSAMPLFIIGDRAGTSCDADIRDEYAKAISEAFGALPPENQTLLTRNFTGQELIGFNDPFKGVHNVIFFGQREQGVNALQIELNEAAYTDDEDSNWFKFSYNERALALLQEIMERAALRVSDYLKNT